MPYRGLVDWGSGSGSAWSTSSIALGSLVSSSDLIGTSPTSREGPQARARGGPELTWACAACVLPKAKAAPPSALRG